MIGQGVSKDANKAVYLWKLAAIRGHELARHNLGVEEMQNGSIELACKHVLISARCGYDEALKKVGEGYKAGLITKDEYASTLREFQTIRNEMMSEQRTKAVAEHEEERRIREAGRRAGYAIGKKFFR